jgi:hypothetical protein
MTPELLQVLENQLHTAGIFSEYPAFQEKGIGGASGIPDLSQTINILIGVDLDEGCIFPVSNP